MFSEEQKTAIVRAAELYNAAFIQGNDIVCKKAESYLKRVARAEDNEELDSLLTLYREIVFLMMDDFRELAEGIIDGAKENGILQ
ncbi:hypothetical protein [Bacillus badius]|uniref:Uncharacterized protein n=1 Tax=Bacillus badius TaxID=1455 RepID=A0ABR5AXV9_BACBA|nr:hypothetical protein [Bacillus badius]KIL79574.1 hypothetical protein SD77_2028 [Bacillus badius]MED4716269.1 hypothetical protein [Bacillus badius]